MNVPLPVGWSRLTLAQVLDSRVGGAWSESCRSNDVGVGVPQPGGPNHHGSGRSHRRRRGPAGREGLLSGRHGGARHHRCRRVGRLPARVRLDVPRGAHRACCARRPIPTPARIGLGGFAVTIRDLPPQNLRVRRRRRGGPADGHGAEHLPSRRFRRRRPRFVAGLYSASAEFLPDRRGHPGHVHGDRQREPERSAQFTVKVVDTTPPEPCPLRRHHGPNQFGSRRDRRLSRPAPRTSSTGRCRRLRSPVGLVLPARHDAGQLCRHRRHGNRSPPETFTVSVGDTDAARAQVAEGRHRDRDQQHGARVSYTVTATDNVDPNPVVKCIPPSGALFPIGMTPVNCKATDAAGNIEPGDVHRQGDRGVERFAAADRRRRQRWCFQQGSTIPVKFRCVDESASTQICDLTARSSSRRSTRLGTRGRSSRRPGRPPGSGQPLRLLADHQPVRDVAGYPSAMAVGALAAPGRPR